MAKKAKKASKKEQYAVGNTMIAGAVAIVILASVFYSPSTNNVSEETKKDASSIDPEIRQEPTATKIRSEREELSHTTITDYTQVNNDKWGNKCRNTHDSCQNWADMGKCDNNPGFMITGCPRSCGTCDELDPLVRCKRSKFTTSPPAIEAGGLNAMFERIADTDVMKDRKPKVLSRYCTHCFTSSGFVYYIATEV